MLNYPALNHRDAGNQTNLPYPIPNLLFNIDHIRESLLSSACTTVLCERSSSLDGREKKAQG
jgi:hypothetical protein